MTQFSADEHVHVLALCKEGHMRIPHYSRNQIGRITEYCGTYLNRADIAVGNTSGCAVDLYRISFAQTQLWPYDAIPPQDALIFKTYDCWLISAKETDHAL